MKRTRPARRLVRPALEVPGIGPSGSDRRPPRVGAPWRGDRCRWPADARYTFGPRGHELILFRPAGDASEPAVVPGRVELALVVEAPLIVLGFRFDASAAWSEAPFAWHLQSRRCEPPPIWSPSARTTIRISRVGTEDGVVRSRCAVALAPAFARELHRAIRAQAARPFDAADYTAAIARLFRDRSVLEGRLECTPVRTVGEP